MTNQPSTRTISTLDYERLELLLQRLPAQDMQRLYLQAELEKATVVDPAEMPPDVISMNSLIQLKLSSNAEIRELQLVYPKDLQSDKPQLSVLAAVGMALLGRRQGDLIQWNHLGTAGKIEVIRLISQPEREGLYYR
ncbi:hypothetical protein A5320_01690 [Rheinheimera sp. SA_1]|jgi:regulator of nucleoside diphosphate kinase|uniref:GreA/GreB family elongation factor n=1 Tax=Rheinheimera sp. SA_1 TaxID=1827365 RepID=UPI0008016573|nr:GreA/GreB family elongation factor [Rheinheimera sp. SA_1]OBP16157.1 hypothetical protein A5320_01690 [Rheinheimera sp. SA_1]